jgi:superfamily I DNA/RNA helicase
MVKALWKVIIGWFGFVDEVDTYVSEHSTERTSEAPFEARPVQATTTPVQPSTKPAQPPERKLYDGNSFKIMPADIATADSLMLKGGRPGPTPSQRKVIFSEATATTVLAGAGSGKSTTLVQRVLFMHKVLKIDLGTMAVFTFTRKSRHDFILKLLAEAPSWDVALNEKQAQRLVRTFHSKALNLARGILGKDERIFEFLGEEQPGTMPNPSQEQPDPEAETLTAAELRANESDAFIDLDGNDAQGEILRDTYAACYDASDRFRTAILRLYCFTLASRPWEKGDAKFTSMLQRLKWMSTYDRTLCQQVENGWKQAGLWPIAGVVERMPGDKRFELQVMGETFLSNGYVEKLGIHVVLGPCEGLAQPSPDLAKHGVKSSLAAVANKRRALLVGSDSPIRYIQSAHDLRNLQLQLAVLDSERGLAAPAVMLRLPNETEKPVFEALYSFGAFVEALGLAPDKLDRLLAFKTWSLVERAVIDCVSIFFTEFYLQLRKRNLVSFNQIFSKFGEQSPDLEKLSISSLIGVKHLLIDEFQDISPLIVHFIRGVQRELLRKSNETQRPTLMCVGDDWQSIYGWRGSAPHFLLKLPTYFPGASREHIEMEANFRSSQNIINCGEAFIDRVKVKSKKRGIASNPGVKGLPHLVGAVETYTSDDVLAAVTLVLEKADENAKVYVLAGKHDDLVIFRSIKDSRLLCTTFHQSKGLEADYVILVGAPKHFGSNDLKNALYEAARFEQRFDDAQRDEAFRVAYVAATRAKKLCVWFAEPNPGSVIEEVPADGRHRLQLDRGGVVDYVIRCLEYAEGNR